MKLEVKKKTAAKVLGIFFLAMAVCTFLSRAAASMTVPLADIQKVKEGIRSADEKRPAGRKPGAEGRYPCRV